MRIDKLKFNLKLKSKANERCDDIRHSNVTTLCFVIETKRKGAKKNCLAYLRNAKPPQTIQSVDRRHWLLTIQSQFR